MVKFNNSFTRCFIVSLKRFCPQSHRLSAYLTPLETYGSEDTLKLPRNSLTPLDSQIIARGSVGDFNTYLGLRCSKKVEKH